MVDGHALEGVTGIQDPLGSRDLRGQIRREPSTQPTRRIDGSGDGQAFPVEDGGDRIARQLMVHEQPREDVGIERQLEYVPHGAGPHDRDVATDP